MTDDLPVEGQDQRLQDAIGLLRAKDFSQAAGIAEELCRAAPDHAKAHQVLGAARLRLEDVDGGLAALERACELGPELPEVWLGLTEALLRLARLDQAREVLGRALEQHPDNAFLLHFLAQSQLRSGDRTAAEAACERAIIANPHYAPAQALLGHLRIERGALQPALAHLLAARHATPPIPDPYTLLGFCLYHLDRLPELLQLPAASATGQDFGEAVLLALDAWQTNQPEACRQQLVRASQLLERAKGAPNQPLFALLAAYLRELSAWKLGHPEQYRGQAHGILYAVGDDHVLGPAHLLVPYNKGSVVVPKFIPGLKAWHLASGEDNRQRAAFMTTLERLPRNSRVLISCGELDCRLADGIYDHLNRHPDAMMEQVVDRLVKGYVETVLAATGKRLPFVLFTTPPASALPAALLRRHQRQRFEAIQRRFCLRLRDICRNKRLVLVDLQRSTVDERGEVRRQLYIGQHHLLPQGFIEAFARGPAKFH
jgi:tetratricopeptide (TPR) repeat protein